MREIFDRFVPLRGKFSVDLSLLEGNNRQFCPSLRDFYIIDYSVLVCFFTPLVVQGYMFRPLFVFPHISYAQLGGVAFTASIFVCIITRI